MNLLGNNWILTHPEVIEQKRYHSNGVLMMQVKHSVCFCFCFGLLQLDDFDDFKCVCVCVLVQILKAYKHHITDQFPA